MGVVTANFVIAFIVIILVACVDSSVFFLSEDTEELLYYDENVIQDEESGEFAQEDTEDVEYEGDEYNPEDSGDLTEVTEDIEDYAIDLDDITKDFVSSVKEDSR